MTWSFTEFSPDLLLYSEQPLASHDDEHAKSYCVLLKSKQKSSMVINLGTPGKSFESTLLLVIIDSFERVLIVPRRCILECDAKSGVMIRMKQGDFRKNIGGSVSDSLDILQLEIFS